MGYPTQGHIAKDLAELKKLVQECESEIDRIKQLAVRNGELIREVLKKLES